MSGTTLEAISPCFIVTDVNRTLAFYCDKLGFQNRFREPDLDPFFAIVGRDAAQIFVKAEKDVLPRPNHTRHRHMRLDAFVYVEDPDVLAAELSGRGVEFISPLKDTSDGLRGFEIRDPDGYVLFFGRPRESKPRR
jgi:catechol 2,3-dioxygenase-like lactoylglutathione lyase family enzyme